MFNETFALILYPLKDDSSVSVRDIWDASRFRENRMICRKMGKQQSEISKRKVSSHNSGLFAFVLFANLPRSVKSSSKWNEQIMFSAGFMRAVRNEVMPKQDSSTTFPGWPSLDPVVNRLMKFLAPGHDHTKMQSIAWMVTHRAII